MGNIKFNDLSEQQKKIRPKIDAAICRVLDHGQYISGPEIDTLERKLEKRLLDVNCVSCGNGTDALVLALLSLNLPPRTHVLVPSFTFAATVEAVINANFIPIFVDIDPNSFNVCPDSVKDTIAWSKQNGLHVSAMISVDLFGLPADYLILEEIARVSSIKLICDAAQSFGASIEARDVGSFGDISTTSFFPTKPLACYGDGGAVFCKDNKVSNKIRSLKIHGKGDTKYDNIYVGINSRLDTIQAAILLEKLNLFDDEVELRNDVANYYLSNIPPSLTPQKCPSNYTSVWAQFCMLATDNNHRKLILDGFYAAKIPIAIYYPVPIHTLKPYQSYQKAPKGLSVTSDVCSRIFAIPMSPYISKIKQDYILENLMSYCE